MKNGITDILNSLFSSSPDKSGPLKNGAANVSLSGKSTPESGTFEDVLAQLTTEDPVSPPATSPAPGNVPSSVEFLPASPLTSGGALPAGSFFESLTALSEVDVKITERIHVDNLAQLAQAEQSLLSFASGLSKLVSLFSNLQSLESTQAQAALVSLSGGKISAEDAKDLLNNLQNFVSQLPDPQNPLLLPPDQQSAFLNQMLQQMLQTQQILFGALGDNQAPASVGSGTFQGGDVFLQMSFSETQLFQFQQTPSQGSQVFIDLQTFQMSATFLQAGNLQNPGLSPGLKTQGNFESLPLSETLRNALDQMFSNSLSTPSGGSVSTSQTVSDAPAPSPSEDLNKTFKVLVQLLVQTGASQAVLTSYLNQQKDLSASGLKQTPVPQTSLDQWLQSLTPASTALSVSRGGSSADISTLPAPVTTRVEIDQIFTQASLVDFQAGPGLLSNPTVLSAALDLNKPSPSVLAPSSAMDANVLKALNEVVARLNSFSSQLNPVSAKGLALSTPEITSNQPLMISPIPPAPLSQVSSSGSVPDPIPTVSLGEGSGVLKDTAPALPQGPAPQTEIDPQLLRALNQLVASLNASMPGLAPAPKPQPQVQAGPSVSGPSPLVPLKSEVQDIHSLVQNLATSGLAQVLDQNQAPVSPSETDKIQASINELISINQFIQARANGNKPEAQANQVLIRQALLTQVQFIQTSIGTGKGSAEKIQTLNLTPAPTAPENPGLTTALPLNPPAPPNPVKPEATVVPTPVVTSFSPSPLPPPKDVSLSVSGPSAPPEVTPNQPPPGPLEALPGIQVTTGLENQVNQPVSSSTNFLSALPATPALNVPLSIGSGEVLKTALTPPAPQKTNNEPTTSSVSPLADNQGIQPLTPQAIAPVVGNHGVTVDLAPTNDFAKNTGHPLSEIKLNLGATPIPLVMTNPAGDKSSAASQANNQGPAPRIDSFALLNQVTDQIKVHASEVRAVSRLDFQLIPESLGRVTVQIALVDHAVSARIIVSNPEVKESLQHHLVELKTALNQAGLQIDQLQVQVQGGSSNLLAQYYQYQQEGFGYRLPVSAPPPPETPETVENTGVLGDLSIRMSLLDVLA